MKVLFLDIDGVLNYLTYKSSLPYPLSEFDPLLISKLNLILEKTGAKLVLSSDWRFMEGIENIFKSVGIISKIYGITPSGKGKSRGHEIKMWMEGKEITRYCILDDLPKDSFLPVQLGNYIHINPNTGLTDKDVREAINLLKPL